MSCFAYILFSLFSYRILALEAVRCIALEKIFSHENFSDDKLPIEEATSVEDDERPPLSMFTSSKQSKTPAQKSEKSINPESSEDDCNVVSGKHFDLKLNPIRENLSNFLPGICTAASRVCVADEKQGHKVTLVSGCFVKSFLLLV